MPYLALLPSVICGLALSVKDLRRREVPRAWVAIGVLAQFGAFVIGAMSQGDASLMVTPLMYGLAAFCIQLAIGKIQAGALGLGDATASFMVGQAVGSLGFEPFLIWWMAMSLLGLVWIIIWSRVIRSTSTSQTPSITAHTTRTDPSESRGKSEGSAISDVEVTQDRGGTHQPSAPVVKVPFVPVIVLAGIISAAMTAL
jgi:leader peptidase (prepilin peptidase) / N-methyltransferase